MAKEKNKKVSEPENDYYKLNTNAVNRLVEADKGHARKVPDAELNKYKSSKLSSIPVPVKALFIKFWFAGASCFFFYWGLSAYIGSWLDQMFVLGMGLGIVTDLLTNNALRFISTDDKEYYPYMMIPSKKYWTFFGNILYAYLLLFLTICVYRLFKMNVEPVFFGIVYTAFDYLLIKVKDYFVHLLQKRQGGNNG